jgi:hypothetical protein
MEDPDDPDRFPPVENDNYRPRPVYDSTGRPKIIIGDAARPASKAKRLMAVPLASMVIMLVALMTVGIWMIVAKLMP